jgi:dTDP-4-amino-4,6-dideoxygalactose transaminase
VRLPSVRAGEESHVWHLFVVRVPTAPLSSSVWWRRACTRRSITSIAPHHQQAYAQSLGHLKLPLTEALHREVVSLPISPVMTDEQVAHAIAVVNA